MPVYYYQFAYVGRYTVTRYPDGDLRPVHVDDMLYLFVMNIFAPAYGPNDPESVTIERMTRLWTQFALTGYTEILFIRSNSMVLITCFPDDQIAIRMEGMTRIRGM